MILLLFSTQITCYALSDGDITNVLKNNSKFFVQNSIFLDAIRWLCWKIIQGLVWVANGCQELYKSTLGLIDFTTYPELSEWIQTFKIIFVALLSLSLAWYGTLLILNHKKVPNILHSILLTGVAVSAVSYIMITVNSGMYAFCSEVAGDSFSVSAVNDNIYDLVYIDQINGLETLSQSEEYLTNCHYPESQFDIDMISINEVLNYKDSRLSSNAKSILEKKVISDVASDGSFSFTLETVNNGVGWNSGDDADLFNEFYYRYHFNGFPIIVSLVSIIIVYICTSYKTARIIYELAIKRLLAYLYSADVTGMQKTIKIFSSIKDGYIVLMLCAILLKIFKISQTFLSNRFGDSGFTYCMLLFFIACAVVDGPVLIQELTGIDAGLSSGISKLVVAYQAARMAKSGITNTVRSGVGAARHHSMMNALKNGKSSAEDKGVSKEAKSNIDNDKDSKKANEDQKNDMPGASGADNQSSDKDKQNMNPGEKNLGGNKDDKDKDNIGKEDNKNSINGFNPDQNEKKDPKAAMNDMKKDLGKTSKNASGKNSGKNGAESTSNKGTTADKQNLNSLENDSKGNIDSMQADIQSKSSPSGNSNLKSNGGNSKSVSDSKQSRPNVASTAKAKETINKKENVSSPSGNSNLKSNGGSSKSVSDSKQRRSDAPASRNSTKEMGNKKETESTFNSKNNLKK